MSLFNNGSILELNNFGFRQSNRDHFFDAELGEGLIIKQRLLDLRSLAFSLCGMMNLEHQSELEDVNVIDRSELKVAERSPTSDTIVLRGRLRTEMSHIEMSFADGSSNGQTCKAEKGAQFDKRMHLKKLACRL